MSQDITPDQGQGNGELTPLAGERVQGQLPVNEQRDALLAQPAMTPVRENQDAGIADHEIAAALEGIDSRISKALTGDGNELSPLPSSIHADIDKLPDQIDKLDWAARLLQTMASRKDISAHERNRFLIMVHKLLMMIITLAVILNKNLDTKKALKNGDSPSLRVLQHADEEEQQRAGIAHGEAAGFMFGRAMQLVFKNPDRYGIHSREDFCADLIEGGNAVELLENLDHVPADLHQTIIVKCLEKAAKHRSGGLLEKILEALPKVQKLDVAATEKLLATKNEEAIKAALRMLVAQNNEDTIIETVTRWLKKKIKLDDIIGVLMEIPYAERKKSLLLKILSTKKEVLQKPYKHLQPPTITLLHDFMPDWVAQAAQFAQAADEAKKRRAKAAPEKGAVGAPSEPKPVEKISTPEALLKKAEADYVSMESTFDKYRISTEGMPSWEQVRKGLTPEVLEKALKLAEPTLLLVPPTSRQSKVEAINKHPAKGQKYDTATYELENHNLWNGGKPETEKQWRVSIVDGVQDVQQDNKIYDGKRTNYEMTKLWVKKYEDQGLDVINDADTYLTLMMKGLAEGKPLDPKYWTVLNGKNLTATSLVAGGRWYGDQVLLSRGSPADVNSGLRLRGSVGVDVPEA